MKQQLTNRNQQPKRIIMLHDNLKRELLFINQQFHASKCIAKECVGRTRVKGVPRKRD